MVTAAKFLRALSILELVQPARTYKCKWHGTSEYSRRAAGSTSCRRLASPQSVKGCNVTTPDHEETSPEKRKERRYKVPCGAAMKQTAATLHYSSARFLKIKMHELRIYTETNFECHESCIMVFTETWLHQDLTLFGSWKDFTIYTSHKKVRKPDIKLVCLSLRPFYLPRKFGNIILNPMTTLRAPVFILGDFNSPHPGFQLYVENLEKILVKCCGKVDNAYRSRPYRPWYSAYYPLVLNCSQVRPQVKTVKVWMKDSIKSLRVFFFFPLLSGISFMRWTWTLLLRLLLTTLNTVWTMSYPERK